MTKSAQTIAAAAKLRAHRLNRGESQRAFARRLGLTARIVQNAEDGRVPRPVNALTLANELRMKVESLWPPSK